MPAYGKTIKVNLDNQKKLQTLWLVTTLKQLIRTSISKLRPPLFSFKLTKEAALQNRKILANFNGDLVDTMEISKGSPLDYGSEFWDLTRTAKLFSLHEDKDKIMDMIQQGSQYHLLSIEKSNITSIQPSPDFLDARLRRCPQSAILTACAVLGPCISGRLGEWGVFISSLSLACLHLKLLLPHGSLCLFPPLEA